MRGVEEALQQAAAYKSALTQAARQEMDLLRQRSAAAGTPPGAEPARVAGDDQMLSVVAFPQRGLALAGKLAGQKTLQNAVEPSKTLN